MSRSMSSTPSVVEVDDVSAGSLLPLRIERVVYATPVAQFPRQASRDDDCSRGNQHADVVQAEVVSDDGKRRNGES